MSKWILGISIPKARQIASLFNMIDMAKANRRFFETGVGQVTEWINEHTTIGMFSYF